MIDMPSCRLHRQILPELGPDSQLMRTQAGLRPKIAPPGQVRKAVRDRTGTYIPWGIAKKGITAEDAKGSMGRGTAQVLEFQR